MQHINIKGKCSFEHIQVFQPGNEVLIRRKRGNNTQSSLNIGLVLLATPLILSHVGAKLALLACRSGKTEIYKIRSDYLRHKPSQF